MSLTIPEYSVKTEITEELNIKIDPDSEALNLIPACDNEFQCSYCEKSFGFKSALKSHEVIHAIEKQFKCKECEKYFATQSSLRRHERIHTLAKPHKCQSCNKKISEKSYLEDHEKSHSGTKPYKCEFCNKNYRKNNSLKDHMRRHTGEKPYKCDYCEKYFFDTNERIRHETIHTSTKTMRKPLEIFKTEVIENFVNKPDEDSENSERTLNNSDKGRLKSDVTEKIPTYNFGETEEFAKEPTPD